MSNYDDSQSNANDSTQNIGGVPYTSVPFSQMSAYDSDQLVASQLNIQNTWGGVNLKTEPHHISQGAGQGINGGNQMHMDDDYCVDQDNVMKQLSVNGNVGVRFLNDRERIQLHNQLSWEEAAKQDVLVVRCRDTTAELYKTRLGSGSKGKCIKMGDVWLSPTEFETLAGRGSSKDWKRSIRFGGHTLQKLIEEGILAPHAISCTCSICCGDSTLTGPVRLFTPYKRKRRDADGGTRSGSMEINRHSMGQNLGNSMNLGTTSLGNGTNVSQLNQSLHASGGNFSGDQVDEVLGLIMNATQQLKIAWDQLRIQNEALRENAVNQLRVQAEMDKREALAHQRSEVVNILKRLLPNDQDNIIQQLVSQLHMENMASSKSCSNCGRDAYLECTACRRACYCSTFCQQKDWPQHQHHCGLSQQSDHLLQNELDGPLSGETANETQE